jgi:hypothetical protein
VKKNVVAANKGCGSAEQQRLHKVGSGLLRQWLQNVQRLRTVLCQLRASLPCRFLTSMTLQRGFSHHAELRNNSTGAVFVQQDRVVQIK